MADTQDTLTSLDDLVAAGLIDDRERDSLRPVEAAFAVRITETMRARIAQGDALQGVRAQFIPSTQELDIAPLERDDPIGDDSHSPLPGLVHRYPDRVLLKAVGTCAVYCRFCFRREMVGPAAHRALSKAQIEAALDYVRQTPQVQEVILSGGDPFILSPERAATITAALMDIDHVSIIRWHTRVPVVDPDRVTPAFINAMTAPHKTSSQRRGKTIVVAIHANRAEEFTPAAETAIRHLRNAGILLVSQSVLLKGINDTPEALEALMRAFLRLSILPHYLHHGDLARGTGHFRTSLQEGLDLVDGLRGRISGLAQPTYVLDLPGGGGKVRITRELIESGGAQSWSGDWHPYPPKG